MGPLTIISMGLSTALRIRNFGASLTLLLVHLTLCPAHREHKVHNIVLYPDKESWCKTTPIKQVVTWPSCNSQELDNNVCVGACFSYMVPHSEPSAPGDLIRPYCDSCQPLDSIWHTVTLDCKDKDDNPTTMQKKVQIITNCSCSSCMESSRIKPDLNSLLQSLELERFGSNHHHHQQQHHHQHLHQQQHHPQQQEQQQQQTPTPEQVASSSSSTSERPEATSSTSTTTATSPAPVKESSLAPPAEPGMMTPPATGAVESQLPETLSLPLPSVVEANVQTETGALAADAVVAVVPTSSPAPPAPAPAPDTSDSQPENKVQTQEQQQTYHFNETPDLLLNPNLSGHSTRTSNGSGNADERFLQLFKQMNEPNLERKLEMLGKLESLDSLVKLKKLATDYPEGKELLAKISELLHKYSNQEEQLSGLDPLDDGDDSDQPNDELLQLHPTSAFPPLALPDEPKDPDDEDVPSLQDQQLRVAASLLHRTGPHHSMVLDAGVKEKIEVESHYLHPALEGQEISYHDNGVVEKTKEDKKDF